LYALNPDGSVKWKFPTRGEIVSSPIVDAENIIYFGSHDKRLYALRPDGTKKWEFLTEGQIVSSPTVDGNTCLYFTSVNGLFYALNLDGTEKWRLRTGGVGEGSPTIGPEGSIYVGVNEFLWRISPDGKKQWQRAGEGFVDAAPLIFSDGTVCFASRAGHVIALDPLSPILMMRWWHYVYGEAYASPAVSPDGMLYLTSHEALGRLCAMRCGQTLAKTPWPKFRGNPRNTGNVNDIR
jgi:outer membrane protein assembly factor BamB